MDTRSHLEWPFFSDAHRRLAEDLDAWTRQHLGHRGEEVKDEVAATRAIALQLGASGWLRYFLPRQHGGHTERIDVRSVCLIREVLASHLGIADSAFAMQGLGSVPITLFGSDDLKRRYLPGVAAGTQLAAFCLSEEEAGSDVAAMRMEARRDGEDYVLNGTKTWISNAGIAGHYVVFARTGEAPGAKGLSAFVVDAGAPGLSVPERIAVIAPHVLGTVAFENCRVPRERMLGEPGDGFKIAMAALDMFRPTVGAAALGFARRALEEAVRRVTERQVFGQKLARFQATRMRLSDMAVEVDAAALLVYRAAWTRDCLRDRVTLEGSAAKLYATEAAQRVIDSAVQLFGGLGVTVGSTVERLYREIRPLRIYEGTSEIQKLVIASQLVGRD
ncbi:MAG: acyl-CoA dehydrogenase family protein [Betaproteobacteria bacterium]|nr:acyl-CoA dehydrogenase family protein [Betaproteobacteria bacterium]